MRARKIHVLVPKDVCATWKHCGARCAYRWGAVCDLMGHDAPLLWDENADCFKRTRQCRAAERRAKQ